MTPTGLWSPIQADSPPWTLSLAVAVAALVAAIWIGWLAPLGSKHRLPRDSTTWSPNPLRRIHERMRALCGQLRRIARIRLPGWRNAILDALMEAASNASAGTRARQAEARLTRWKSVLAMLLLLGLAVVWSGFGR